MTEKTKINIGTTLLFSGIILLVFKNIIAVLLFILVITIVNLYMESKK